MAALRMRLAAQADAALASGSEDPLKQLMESNANERKKQPEVCACGRTLPEVASVCRSCGKNRQETSLEIAAKLMLQKPTMEKLSKNVKEPIDLESLRRAAEAGDLGALAKMDKRFKMLLDNDETLRSLMQEGSVNADPKAKDALALYRHSFMALEGDGLNAEKQAFKAVMNDDVDTLQAFLDLGVRRELKNSGGQTLLQVARERGKENCAQALLSAGARY